MKFKLFVVYFFFALATFLMGLLQFQDSVISPREQRGRRGKGGIVFMILVIAAILCLYYIIYFLAILISCKSICQKDKTTKLIFTINQIVHLFFIAAVWGGVYS